MVIISTNSDRKLYIIYLLDYVCISLTRDWLIP